MAKNSFFTIVVTLSACLIAFFVCLGAIANPAFAAEPTQVLQLRETKICQNCDLSRAYLVATDLTYAYLQSADLSSARLSFANLDHASLGRTNFSDALLDGAIVTNAKLLFANFSNANLAGADLSGANLNSANLEGTNLRGANLEGADLSYVRNLSIEQVQSAKNWQKAIYSRKFRKQLMASID
jgi:uncharacterized protein YjbI with pentapeptide repeats